MRRRRVTPPAPLFASMGPRKFFRGNRPLHRSRRLYNHGFNGAAEVLPRKCRNNKRKRFARQCFNGAAEVLPRKSRPVHRCVPPKSASMGPRKFFRGNKVGEKIQAPKKLL